MASNKIEQTVKCSFSLALLSVMQKCGTIYRFSNFSVIFLTGKYRFN